MQTNSENQADREWFNYYDPAREFVRAQNAESTAEDQILRTIKKLVKGQIEPEEAKEEAKKYFEHEGIEFLPEHINIINSILEYLQSLPEFESARIDAQLAAELQVERKREERDIVFVIMQLAA